MPKKTTIYSIEDIIKLVKEDMGVDDSVEVCTNFDTPNDFITIVEKV